METHRECVAYENANQQRVRILSGSNNVQRRFGHRRSESYQEKSSVDESGMGVSGLRAVINRLSISNRNRKFDIDIVVPHRRLLRATYLLELN